MSWSATGWREHSQSANQHAWVNDSGEAMVAMRVAMPPDIPEIGGRESVLATREYFRQSAAKLDGGIVEVEHRRLNGRHAVRTLIKRRLEPRGFGFVGSWLIPFRDSFYVIRFEAREHGITGVREAAVMLVELPNPQLDESGKMVGWMVDPYDRAHDQGAMYTLADQEKYDAMLPDHPLSSVRRYLDDFQKTARFNWWLRLKPQHMA